MCDPRPEDPDWVTCVANGMLHHDWVKDPEPGRGTCTFWVSPRSSQGSSEEQSVGASSKRESWKQTAGVMQEGAPSQGTWAPLGAGEGREKGPSPWSFQKEPALLLTT